MTRCNAITAAGTACKGTPIPGESYCYVHHPDTLEARKQAGSRGASGAEGAVRAPSRPNSRACRRCSSG